MRGIFISYRRDDAEGQAGRLFDDLSAHFGRDAVFMDVAGIKKGLDFRRIIDEHVASCGVLLVIIGKRWLSATDTKGKRRLDDVNDFVRLETAAALSRDIPVVPVLVQDAVMPTEQDLPSALKELAYRNGTELTHARWDSDVKLLIEDLKPYLEVTAPATHRARDDSSDASTTSMPPIHERPSAKRSPWIAAGAAMVVVAGSTLGYYLLKAKPTAHELPVVAIQTPPVQTPPVSATQRPPGSAVATQPIVSKPTPTEVPAKAEAPPAQIDSAKAVAGKADAAKADAAKADAAKADAAKADAARAAADAAAAKAAAAKAAAAAAARKAAEEKRLREEAERATQLAEEQRIRDAEARRIALEQATERNRIAAEQAEKNRIAAEQAAGAKIFADIATTIIGSRRR